MASEEHKKCADVIKNTHSNLRSMAKEIGAEEAWNKHCEDLETLQCYAENMKRLATDWWEKNSADTEKDATSRITWIAEYCQQYFNTDVEKYRNRDLQIAKENNHQIKSEFSSANELLEVLDVGSCYNPFDKYKNFNTLPIDLCPAEESVYKCDFLNVEVGPSLIVRDKTVHRLAENHFHVVVFSLLLEYFPSSSQRKECCRKALQLLKPEGILVIITPDSKHVGANAKIMKNWRYTLSLMGLSRIKYEKLPYLHCMAFRKSLSKEIAVRWAQIYKEDYMSDELNIPQDFQEQSDTSYVTKSLKYNEGDVSQQFEELPFAE